MAKCQRVLIMAGGTGGHVFPGLAVAKQFHEMGVDVQWLGTQKGLEAHVVPEANIPLHLITISGLRGKGWKDVVFAPWRLAKAIFQSIRIIRQLKPDVVLGMGGFVSGPGGIASWLLRCPLVVHEQNAKAGLTNRWLAKIAKKVLEGFPNTFSERKSVVTTGNPVRAEIAAVAPRSSVNSPLHLLVVGGSLGAAAINKLVPNVLAALPAYLRPEVMHQTGELTFADTQRAYQEAGVAVELKSFITEMNQAYQWADIVLCRAGALTVAELCAAGRGAILVPYPYAVDDHQTANANYMADKNAAIVIQQRSLTTEVLLVVLKELYATPEKCVAMAQAAYQLRKIDATEQVMFYCQQVCQ